jgi:deazaflavin-dependent oxidoreductase (nitroreductase family)
LPVLLITTVGRKSGKPHTNPIVYLRDGEDYLVTGSAGGMDWNPNWYHNLKAHPDVKVEIGPQAFDLHAIITEGEERNQLYERFKAASSNFAKYEKGTNRVIPVIRLRPH